MHRFPAEWEKQDAVMLCVPHKDTDWNENLPKATACVLEITKEIAEHQKVILCTERGKEIKEFLKVLKANLENIKFFSTPTNDTWVRDFGPITVLHDDKPHMIDFTFNGWGNKYESEKDNHVTKLLNFATAFGNTPLKSTNFILEGGSIESDGQHTIMTTEKCLLNKNRNADLTKQQIEEKLKSYLSIGQILWLKHGFIAGDDTDSHIDTLARFAPQNTIVYVSCKDKNDEHYEELKKMEEELKKFKNIKGEKYYLKPLPLPKIYDKENKRLAATYANFLIINDAVLFPIYNAEEDEEAITNIKEVFPKHKIIPINCEILITQNGSLHCMTMQLPAGCLN